MNAMISSSPYIHVIVEVVRLCHQYIYYIINKVHGRSPFNIAKRERRSRSLYVLFHDKESNGETSMDLKIVIFSYSRSSV